MPFPESGLVYDYKLDDAGITKTGHDEDEEEEDEADDAKKKPVCWRNWMHGRPPFEVPPEAKFSDIIVPTLDTVRSSFILQLLLSNNKTVLAIGPTGTGKSLAIADKLINGMPSKFVPEFIVFSAKTSANQTQDLIDGKLDKRRKGVFGPPLGELSAQPGIPLLILLYSQVIVYSLL